MARSLQGHFYPDFRHLTDETRAKLGLPWCRRARPAHPRAPNENRQRGTDPGVKAEERDVRRRVWGLFVDHGS
jgi:hypothetical protein